MSELSQVIAATINEWNNPFVERAIFGTAEWNTIAAAATYAIAYSARCEHSLDPRNSNFPEGSYREALACYGASPI